MAPDPYHYDGKTAVVTGGATGVGAALIELLAELGAASVTVLDIKEPNGPHDRFLQTDLSDRAAVDAALAALDGPIDVLFNNAGVADTLPSETVFAVNFLALRKLSEGLLPRINPGGAIVNTASIAGGQWMTRLAEITELIGIADWNEAAQWYASQSLEVDTYSFTKECAQLYTMHSSHATLAKNVRTNSVCPAPIDTPLLPDFRKTLTDQMMDFAIDNSGGRLVTAREVALTLAFLGSDAAVFVNGVNLNVDNGFTASMATGQVDFSTLAG
jgi:NAD(P)-dependent dehydrogenase (short-subunit alcohol dehydrogenase family)